jgi:hypothetical protein
MTHPFHIHPATTQALHRHCPTTEIPGAQDLTGQISLREQRVANPILHPILKPSLSPSEFQFWGGRPTAAARRRVGEGDEKGRL